MTEFLPLDAPPQAREEQRQRYHLALIGSDLGLWDWDVTTGIVRFSPRWAQIAGYDKSELTEDFATFERLLHPDDLRETKLLLEQYFAGDTDQYEAEFRMKQKSGGWRWVLSRGKISERAANGEPLRVVGTHLDITDRKRAELALGEHIGQFSMAEEVADVGHWRVDLVNDTIFWSDVVYRIHAVDPQMYELDLETAMKFYHPEDRPLVEECVRLAIEEAKPFAFDCRLIGGDGVQRHVTSRGRPILSEDGDVIALFGVFQDVTKRKEAELLKDQFLATVNHELRSPLTSLIGSLDIIAARITDGDLATCARLLEIGRTSAGRLQRLVNDLLDHQEMSQGVMTYDRQETDALLLLEGIHQRHESYARRYGVTLRKDFNPDGAVLRTDAFRLEQALGNLISNACKFSEDGSEVALQASLDGGHVVFTVADKGVGIPEEKHEKVFERFTRLANARDRQIEGTGLGLPIAKEIIKQLGGSIALQSTLGEGTTFTVRLPVERAAADRLAG